MCLRVDANGWGDGAGTHVSVHVFFMEGSDVDLSDDSFHCKVTIKLVNHKSTSDRSNEKTLCFAGGHPKYDGRKVNLDCVITKFISHSDVESSDNYKLYVINDYLTWRVTNVEAKYYF